MDRRVTLAAILLASMPLASAQERSVADASAKVDPRLVDFATPGPAHSALEFRVGKWSGKITYWEQAGAAPQTTTCTTEIKWILGNRYQHDTTTGKFAGQDFQGFGTVGYDNLKKKYVSTWIDNMGTGLVVSEGTFDKVAKAFTFAGLSPDAMQGRYVSSRSIEKLVDADHWNLDMFSTGPDGKEFKAMAIEYTRMR
jgi:hypothetical protein